MASKKTPEWTEDDPNSSNPKHPQIENGGQKTKGQQIQEEKAASRATLPPVDQTLTHDEAGRAVALLEEGIQLKRELDVKVADSKASRLQEIKDELTMIQQSHELGGLRYGKIVFVARMQDGKQSTPIAQFKQELLKLGVRVETIEEAAKAATKQGDPFWVKELQEV